MASLFIGCACIILAGLNKLTRTKFRGQLFTIFRGQSKTKFLFFDKVVIPKHFAGALTICTENPVNSGENSNGTVHSGGTFSEKR